MLCWLIQYKLDPCLLSNKLVGKWERTDRARMRKSKAEKDSRYFENIVANGGVAVDYFTLVN